MKGDLLLLLLLLSPLMMRKSTAGMEKKVRLCNCGRSAFDLIFWLVAGRRGRRLGFVAGSRRLPPPFSPFGGFWHWHCGLPPLELSNGDPPPYGSQRIRLTICRLRAHAPTSRTLSVVPSWSFRRTVVVVVVVARCRFRTQHIPTLTSTRDPTVSLKKEKKNIFLDRQCW